MLTAQEQKTILACDINLFLDSLSEKEGVNPILRKRSLTEIIEILDNYDGCDIWGIRIPKLNVLLLYKNNFQNKCREVWINFSFQTFCKSL